MKKKIFCIDLDNTICKTVGKNYFFSRPNLKVIKFINKLFENGHYIKIYTSRFMGRNKESQTKAKKQGFKNLIDVDGGFESITSNTSLKIISS